jgi:hypothetical protein
VRPARAVAQLDRAAQLVGLHVVEQQPLRCRIERLADLVEVAALHLDHALRLRLGCQPHRLPQAAGQRHVVLLDQHGVVQAEAVVVATAGRDRRFLQRP